MAKLSANGTEVARFVRRRERNDRPVLRDITYVSVRSNGKVLRKHIAIFVDVYSPNGERRLDKGWKQWDRVPTTGLATLAEALATAGFTQEDRK